MYTQTQLSSFFGAFSLSDANQIMFFHNNRYKNKLIFYVLILVQKYTFFLRSPLRYSFMLKLINSLLFLPINFYNLPIILPYSQLVKYNTTTT